MTDPFRRHPTVPSFTVTSTDVQDGEKLPTAQVSGVFGAGGGDVSPQLSWSGFPAETKAFAVTMYDPDAPTQSGFWHWVVANIPADVTTLATNAGAHDENRLPPGAFHLRNDAGRASYLGAAPPQGHGPHRYFIVVHAIDTDSLGVDENATPAILGFNLAFHTLGRAIINPWYEA